MSQMLNNQAEDFISNKIIPENFLNIELGKNVFIDKFTFGT